MIKIPKKRHLKNIFLKIDLDKFQENKRGIDFNLSH